MFQPALVGLAMAVLAGHSHATPRVVSINLCTDQLLLNLAAPEQILSLSWLASDPDESLLATAASRYPVNYGTAEEIIAFAPDVVLAGSYTSLFTRRLLARLGYAVSEIAPANSLEDIERNLRQVAQAIARESHAEALIADFRARRDAIVPRNDELRVAFVRPGGFTVDRHSLAYALIKLAGVRDVLADGDLDRWGSLPMETLLRAAPDVIAISRYQTETPSLANGWLDHPALAAATAHARTVQVPTKYWACGLPQSLESVDLLLDELARVAPARVSKVNETASRTSRP